MGEKKGKALALELMDDLLNDEVEASPVVPEKSPEKENAKPVKEESSPKGFDFSLSSIESEAPDPNRTEILGQTEVSAPDVPAAPAAEEDRTLRIAPSTVPQATAQIRPGAARSNERASVGRFGAFRSSAPASSTEAALAQSESLRIAQNRLLELETELERLRLQNEELAAAGETLRRRTDELTAANQKRESDYQNAVAMFRQEKELLTANKEALQRDLESGRQKSEELELRISTNIQKIRVRERELENRLELVKMESAALIRSKDEMILDLKRQADQLNLELNNYRSKNQELNRLTTDKQEMLRRTVKALRLALTMLEGEEEAPKMAVPQRKAK